MDLSKIHPKFKNEQQCKNPRCMAYFLDETPHDLCPGCRSRGLVEADKDNTNVVYSETKTEDIVNKIKELEERLQQVSDKRKKPVFKKKECDECGKEFEPHSGHQRLCSSCANKMTK